MIVIISVRVGTEGFNLPVGEGSSLHLYWCWRKGCSSFEWSSVVRFSLFPRTKLYKFKTNQIGYFSFLIAGLPPNGGKCPKGERGAVSKKAKHHRSGCQSSPRKGSWRRSRLRRFISQAASRLYGFSCFTFPTGKARLCGSKLNTNVFVLNNPLIKFNRNPLKKVCEQEIYPELQ